MVHFYYNGYVNMEFVRINPTRLIILFKKMINTFVGGSTGRLKGPGRKEVLTDERFYM
jgi:hypothetical protein